MIGRGVATVYVTNMERAVAFYHDVLGLKVLQQYGDNWASIEVGTGFTLGLHPASPNAPPPGTSGSISIGLSVSQSIDDVVAALTAKGVQFRGPIQDDADGGIRLAFFGDPDGNDLYLCEVTKQW